MEWQLSDIGKTITNNYLAALARSQYVSGDTVIMLWQ